MTAKSKEKKRAAKVRRAMVGGGRGDGEKVGRCSVRVSEHLCM